MRIAFIAGCVEPGRDGVGDYTRTLANECTQLGHDTAIVSLGEPREIAPLVGNSELRLTAAQWRHDGGAAARTWLERFRPDVASLQFVPYSFDPRGLFRASVPRLAQLMAAAPRRHVFFHEVWIGSHTGASPKQRLIGWLQRRSVRALLAALRPAVVHTSNDYYRAALATIGQPAGVLPMFGSVPVRTTPAAVPALAKIPTNALVCGHFGTLHPDWDCTRFFTEFAALARRLERPAWFVAAGGLGYGAARFDALAQEYAASVRCVALGRLTNAELASAFAHFDFAATSVPWNILGKSSAAAALREHGLRVVATAAGGAPRFGTPPEGPADPGFLALFRAPDRLETALQKTPPRAGASAVAARFLSDLHG